MIGVGALEACLVSIRFITEGRRHRVAYLSGPPAVRRLTEEDL